MKVYAPDIGVGVVIGFEDYSRTDVLVEDTVMPTHNEWRYIVRFDDVATAMYMFQHEVKVLGD